MKRTGACCAEGTEMCRGRDMWEAGDIVEGRKEVAQAKDGNVDSLTAWNSFELCLPLNKMHKEIYRTISGKKKKIQE